jgi:hypothetical protein
MIEQLVSELFLKLVIVTLFFIKAYINDKSSFFFHLRVLPTHKIKKKINFL